jgi:hypothetical protein
VVPESLFSPLTSLATAPEGGGSEVTMQVRRSLSAKIRKLLGLGKRPIKAPYGPGAWAAEEDTPGVLQAALPKNLSLLSASELQDARHDRDERMSVLFRRWPALSKLELRELRTLSDERQRLARHVGVLRRLHALRAK